MPESMSLDTLAHTLTEFRHELHALGVAEGTRFDAALEEAARLLYPAAEDASIPGAPVFLLEAIERAEAQAEILGNEWHSEYQHGDAEAIRTVNRALIERLRKEVAGDAGAAE